MTAFDAIKFIHEIAWQGSKPGLSRTRDLLALMGNPEHKLRFVHVAGTNGKGSTSAMLSSTLACAGYKTGLYTSPYISKFNERIQINGQPVSDEALAEITSKIAPLALSMTDRPTEFELVTAIAFEYFAREMCDIVILEAGMGGRLDSTNVIVSPLCSVICNIGLDHMRELGDTVEKIAAEKAGIIKPKCPTVIYDLPDNIRSVIESRCSEQHSELVSADFGALEQESASRRETVFSYKNFRHLRLPLLGLHQMRNAAVALETLQLLRGNGFDISDDAVANGFANTVWPARFEIISDNPFVVVDGGHNPQCAATVTNNLDFYFPDMKKIVLFGVLAGKDYMSMSKIIDSAADEYVTITPSNPLALPADALARELSAFGKPVYPCPTIEDGIKKALLLADENSVICAVGSLYSAGAVREFFGK